MVSLQCVWTFINEFLENADPHTSQENSFSPVYVSMWLLKCEHCKNADPFTSQENGFFPLFVCM